MAAATSIAGASSSAGAASSAGAGVASLFTATGVGVGGIFVAAALVLVLAYLNLVNESNRDHLRTLATAAAVPLFVTFLAIVAFEALVVL